jgi:hypothetical protein
MSETQNNQTLKNVVLTRVLYLNAAIQGIVAGLIVGFAIFLATNWLLLKGGDPVGPHLALLGQFFIGYQVTVLGSFIGFGYGFVVGFVGGFFTTKIYNRFAGLREARRAS